MQVIKQHIRHVTPRIPEGEREVGEKEREREGDREGDREIGKEGKREGG